MKFFTGMPWTLLLAATVLSVAQGLWSEEWQRLNVGIKLFPAYLGAEMTLAERRTSDG